jgi:hypothetical protein
MILAQCGNCFTLWRVPYADDPAVLEGVCMACQEGRNVDRLLVFRKFPGVFADLSELPKDWLIQKTEGE